MKLKFRKAEGRTGPNKSYLCGGEVQAREAAVVFLYSEKLCQKRAHYVCNSFEKIKKYRHSKIYFFKKYPRWGRFKSFLAQKIRRKKSLSG